MVARFQGVWRRWVAERATYQQLAADGPARRC
jgi:hypothetical protein